MSTENKCPVLHDHHGRAGAGARVNRDWWPNQLNLQVLSTRTHRFSSPMGPAFNYAKAFAGLDLDALIKDLHA